MRILNKYITKQVFIGFLLISFSLLAMLWLTQSLHFVEMVTSQGLPVYLFAEMTSLLMPRIFNVLSPIALFVAVLFVYNRMIVDRELVVMQAVGISPWKNANAAVFAGIVLTLFNFYVMNSGIPAAEKKFRELDWQIRNNVSQMIFREGEFTTLSNGITVFIDKHEADGSVSGIFVSDESKPDIKVTLTAEKGRLIQSDSGPRILFINGIRQEINKKDFKFNTLNFTRYSAEFSSGRSSRKKTQTVREKTIFELLNSAKDTSLTPNEVRKNIVEGHRRIIVPFYNLLFALLACTGLLISNFNRRGQTKIVSAEVICMTLISAGDLTLTNLCARTLTLLPLLYLNCIIPILVCIYLLVLYNPIRVQRNSYSEAFADEK